MEQDHSLTEKESLDLISKMIHSAKNSMSDDSIFYLLWGWAVFIAAITQYVLIQVNYPYSWLSWMVLMPATAVVATIIGYRKRKKEQVVTFVDEFMKYLWIAFGVSLVLFLFFQSKIGAENTYPVIIVLYGIGTFVSGGALRFTPLKIGGIICWIMAAIAFYLSSEQQLLILALTVLLSYIIPGYLLQRKFRHETV